jgi:phosphate transport system substrate-binding protein
MTRFVAVILAGALCLGCGKEPGSTRLTAGTLRIEVDESVAPVMEKLVAEFRDQYPDAQISLRAVQAREAIADFFNDSVGVIISARAFNDEERGMLAAAKIEFQQFQVAQSAVAVVAHPEAPTSFLRMTELDSILRGTRTRWKKGGDGPIEVVVGGIDGSINEVVRGAVLGGKPFTLTATPIPTSDSLLRYVATTPNTIGLVGVAWLKGMENRVAVMDLGGPSYRPDSTAKPGQYYAPAQAYVFQGYYPLTTPVFIYTREVSRDLGLGFISYATSAAGQKIVTGEGLVPVTMPVRLVQLTRE